MNSKRRFFKKTDKPVSSEPSFSQSLTTCLGSKGYTLLKSELSDSEISRIKSMLTVKPAAGAVTYGPATQVEYPVYRESAKKIYMPRYFGERWFGPVKSVSCSKGLDIDVPFSGELKPMQVPVVEKYFERIGFNEGSRDHDSSSLAVDKRSDSLFGRDHAGGGGLFGQEDPALKGGAGLFGREGPALKGGAGLFGREGTPPFGGGGAGLLELPCAFGKTVLSLNIISRLKKKTLVIVNKEFLLNQWIERIRQFLPTARVGKIQGPEIDIADKDIVLGMLQSISMKDYDTDVFASFGLTIIDEVHHISSEVFSRALFKIVTPYMLGLSATMERKDGTTGVFKMFLGEVAFKGDRDEKHDVEVRAVEFVSRDAAFNETEYDWKGNAKYSTMITKLSEFNDRSEFIVSVLKDLVAEQPEAQIMVLAHTRALLAYLGESIEHKGFATVGFYVGGMKEQALKLTEDKQIVLATYAMAAEALDIKTLNSLVLATPKTDIVQSVGRILRVKHEKPIVVDIVDKHEVFKKQWLQRRRYFKKCEYLVKMTDSEQGYSKGQWKTVYQPNTNKVCVLADSDGDGEGELQKPGKCVVNIEGLDFDAEQI
jgi:superfamily II DNA or RNA helicase